jgi:streptogramin lyase
MRRRDFMGLATAAATVPLANAIDLGRLKTRKVSRVEIVFDSPGPTPKPNGLQATDEGLWIIDQAPGSKVHLVTYEGRELRSFDTETTASSGITQASDGSLWIGSTYSREIFRVDSTTGKTIERHFTPGAGIIYKMASDPPQRSSPLAKSRQQQNSQESGEGRQEGRGAGRGRGQGNPAGVGGFQMGEVLGGAAPGTGAHGQEWRDGKLWFATPPARSVYCIDPKTWVVQTKFATAANRPHGIGWEGKYLWVTDSNLNAFFKHDPETGEMLEKIQLADSDPLPHGMSIHNGWMWYCDDAGVICRLKM